MDVTKHVHNEISSFIVYYYKLNNVEIEIKYWLSMEFRVNLFSVNNFTYTSSKSYDPTCK